MKVMNVKGEGSLVVSTIGEIDRTNVAGNPPAVSVGSMSSAKRIAWRSLSFFFRKVGVISDGIALGFRHGFDSGPMLDYVYRDQAGGRFLIGRLVDRVYLDAIGWRAIRARKEILKASITSILRARDGQERPTTILDVAAGPGRYLQEIELTRRADGSSGDLTVICRDLDRRGLDQGRWEAAARGLTNFRYEEGDACAVESLATVAPRPDVVVASGLYELLDPILVRRSMAAIGDTLPRGGHFIFTTQVHHPQLELIANLLVNRHGEPWVMECRPLDLVEEWAREAGFVVLESRLEEIGLFGVTTCVKP
jgi:SAM-dependent methyltransferase